MPLDPQASIANELPTVINVSQNGWSPLLDVVDRVNEDDSIDIVFKVVNWIGGVKSKPPVNIYLTGTGTFTNDINLAKPIENNSTILHKVVYVDNEYGGNLKNALEDVAEYTKLILSAKTYDISGLYSHNFNTGFVGNTKKGIVLVGQKTPTLSANGKFLEKGTVIQGTLLNLADGFEVYNLGVDVGADVCEFLYDGEAAEGFVPGTNPTFGQENTLIKNIRVDNVIVLGLPESRILGAEYFKHTFLTENIDGLTISGKNTFIGGYHNWALKSIHVKQFGSVELRGSMNNAIIIKSDEGVRVYDIYLDSLTITGWTYDGTEVLLPKGIVLQSDNPNEDLYNININSVTFEQSKPNDLIIAIGDNKIREVYIGKIYQNALNNGGPIARMGYTSAPEVDGFTIGETISISGGRAYEFGQYAKNIDIGRGYIRIEDDPTVPVFDLLGQVKTGRITVEVTEPQTSQYILVKGENATVYDTDIVFLGESGTIGFANELNVIAQKDSDGNISANYFSTQAAIESSLDVDAIFCYSNAEDGFIRAYNADAVRFFLKTSLSGNTASRPSSGLYVGIPFFDTTLGKPIWHDGVEWVDATGASV